MAIQPFQKDDIVLDYHGKVVMGYRSVQQYADAEPNVEWEYCFEVPSPKRIIDASSTVCPIENHKGMRCLGRLVNHVTQRTRFVEANLKPVQVQLPYLDQGKDQGTKYLVFKARRTINPFEQLRYDYNDKVAQTMFTE